MITRQVYITKFVIYLLILVMLLTLQQVANKYVHFYAMFPDVILCFLILFLFNVEEEYTQWFFIIGFIIGMIYSVWISQRLGIASLFYVIITMPFQAYSNIIGKATQVFITVLLALILKFIVYISLSVIFKEVALQKFLLSIEFLYQIIATLLFTIIIIFPLNYFFKKRKR